MSFNKKYAGLPDLVRRILYSSARDLKLTDLTN